MTDYPGKFKNPDCRTDPNSPEYLKWLANLVANLEKKIAEVKAHVS